MSDNLNTGKSWYLISSVVSLSKELKKRRRKKDISTSNSKCLLCQKPLDISSESSFILLMQSFLSNFCWLSTFFLTPLDKITMINRTQKILAQNKSNKPQQENKSNQVNMRHTRPNQQLKGSVFDKIKIFENKNSKPEII